MSDIQAPMAGRRNIVDYLAYLILWLWLWLWPLPLPLRRWSQQVTDWSGGE